MAVKYGINHVSECAVYGSFDSEAEATNALDEKLSDDADEDDYEIVQLRESIDEMVVKSDSDDEDEA